MAYGLPARGQNNWDDELNNSIDALHGDVQSAVADAANAVSTANTAKNTADAAQAAASSSGDAAVHASDAAASADSAALYANGAQASAAAAQAAQTGAQTAKSGAEQARDAAAASANAAAAPTDSMVAGLVPASSGSATASALKASFVQHLDLVAALPNPFYIAHRGGYAVYPEHSIEGYRAAVASGFIPEMDLGPLSDGTLVSNHDATVDRTMVNADGTAATGNVSSFTLAQWLGMRLKPVRTGAPAVVPPTWKQILNEFGGRVLICPEIKDPSATTRDKVISDIKARGLERAVIVQSNVWANAQAVAAAGICTGYLADTIGNTGQPTFADVKAAGVEFVIAQTTVPDSYVTNAIAAGLRVIVWTTNTKASAAAKIALGAAGVFSDDPWFVASRNTKQDTDPLRFQLGAWSGMGIGGNYNDPANLWLAPPNKVRIGTTAGAYKSIGLTWAGTRPSGNVRIQFTVDYQATATAQTAWCGIAYGQYQDSDTYYRDTATTGQNCYHAIARRSGVMGLYKALTGAGATSIASATAGAEFAAAGAVATHRFMLEITATGITWKNLTTGTTVTSADTSLRNSGRLTLTGSGTTFDAYDFSVEDL